MKKEKSVKSVAVEETPSVVVPAPEEVVEVKAPQTFLVRWLGGEERFDTLARAQFCASTHKGGYIVV